MNVIKRLEPFWETYENSFFKDNRNHLIIAHSNSLRAIVKILDKLSDKAIMKINIPTGVPLVYTFNDNKIVSKKYLIDEEELLFKQNLVKKQGKAQWN